MIKGTTALRVFIDFIDKYGREPEKEEFIKLGYGRSTYYQIKNKYQNYLIARIEEKEDGGSPILTYEDDMAEGFLKVDGKLEVGFEIGEKICVPKEKERLAKVLIETNNWSFVEETKTSIGSFIILRRDK